MKWTPLFFGSLTAVALTACGGERRNNDTGTAGGAEMESGTTPDTTALPPGAGDTSSATGAMSADTAPGGARMHGDTVRSGGDTTGSSQ